MNQARKSERKLDIVAAERKGFDVDRRGNVSKCNASWVHRSEYQRLAGSSVDGQPPEGV